MLERIHLPDVAISDVDTGKCILIHLLYHILQMNDRLAFLNVNREGVLDILIKNQTEEGELVI